ncbi:MAG: Cu+-exporting ATPase [Sphingobacteriales bacterium]|jgi:Cu+-exporting ATPase
MESTTEKSKVVELEVTGMTCANCALTVQKSIEKHGINKVFVNVSANEVRFNNINDSKLDEIISSIEAGGYKVVQGHNGKKTPSRLTKEEWLFYSSLVFSVPLLAHMFISWEFLHNPLVQFILALPVMAIGVYYFGKSAYHSLKVGVPNMDVLIIMGSGTAFIYSLIGLIQNLGPNFLFFETATTIISLVLLGNVIEAKSVKSTRKSIKLLQDLQPKIANKLVLDTNGKEVIQQVPFKELKKYDIVQVNEGDRIPIDGKVLVGFGEVDESVLTGESAQLSLQKDSQVKAGTVLISGNLKIQTEYVRGETMFGRILELVKGAEMNKPQIQKLGDKVSAIFVPVVIGIAVLTVLVSYYGFGMSFQTALLHAIAVLVISCPCAMGLATPTAVSVGIGLAAKSNILIKSGVALETIAKAKTILFDKTGTLTTGNLQMSNLKTSGITLEEAKSLILELEKYSSHPIAKALIKQLQGAPSFKFKNVEEIKGKGIKAEDNDGNIYFLGASTTDNTIDLIADIMLLKNNEPIASFHLEDEVRPFAKETITRLKAQGFETILLSGDSDRKCMQIAKEIGIGQVYSQQLPLEKLQLISIFSGKGVSIMVGDGVNDAPSLQRADVGISLGQASEIAIESSDVILSKSNLLDIVKVIELSKETITTIKQNLFWAFSYNIVAIPIAAIGLLNPMFAALFMAFSDIVVIGNSIRLKFRKFS